METTTSANPAVEAPILTWRLVASPRQLDAFMKAADVFETFKFLVERIEAPTEIQGRLRPGVSVAQSCQNLREAIEKDGTYQVLAVWCEDDHTGAWRHPQAKVISTGKKWLVFDDYLRAYGAPASLLPWVELRSEVGG